MEYQCLYLYVGGIRDTLELIKDNKMERCNDGRILGFENSDEDLEQVRSILKKQEEVKGQLSKTESRLDGLIEGGTEIGDKEPSSDRSKLVRDLSFHIYEVVDRRNSQRRQESTMQGCPGGEEDLGSLIKILATEHQDVETRLQTLETRVDRLEQEYQSRRDEADAVGHSNNPQGLRMGLSISLSSLNSISEAINEEGETDSIAGSDIGSASDIGKDKSHQFFAFRRKKKERRSSDGSLEGNEGFHERMSLKMAHVSAKLGKIGRVSRSVKVASSKEEDKDDKKVLTSEDSEETNIALRFDSTCSNSDYLHSGTGGG